MKEKIVAVIMLFVIAIIAFLTSVDYASLDYKTGCAKNYEPACAKYLFVKSWSDIKAQSYGTNLEKQDWDYWKNRYLDKLETREDAYVAIETMIASLDDPFTRFLTPEEYKNQSMSISSKLSGIGVVISSVDGKITVEDVIEDSPAFKNDLKIGDLIIKIDGNSVAGFKLQKVAEMIRGQVGSKVKLSILRNGKLIEKTITRAEVKIKAVSYKMLENDIAYIRLTTFMSNNAFSEFVEALKKTENSKAIILDLRGNQGGLLQNAILIADIFLTDGEVVKILRKDNKTENARVKNVGMIVDKPMVVLINGLTASAGEILAGALKDNGRALLVGEKTFGKGLIQRIMPLPLDTAMNVTIAKYLTPAGIDIHKNGIQPNHKVALTIGDVRENKDPQLDKAVELLK